MPPAPFDGVVNSTQVFADRTLEMFPGHVLESQFQAFRFSLKAALGYSPLATQSQCCGKKFLRCHPSLLSPRSLKMQIHPCFAPRTKYQQFLRLRDRSEERAKGYQNAKGSNLPSAERSLLKRETE